MKLKKRTRLFLCDGFKTGSNPKGDMSDAAFVFSQHDTIIVTRCTLIFRGYRMCWSFLARRQGLVLKQCKGVDGIGLQGE